MPSRIEVRIMQPATDAQANHKFLELPQLTLHICSWTLPSTTQASPAKLPNLRCIQASIVVVSISLDLEYYFSHCNLRILRNARIWIQSDRLVCATLQGWQIRRSDVSILSVYCTCPIRYELRLGNGQISSATHRASARRCV